VKRLWAWVDGRIVVMLAEAMAAVQAGEDHGDEE
jgi:hypothetical protein